jgi:hypothetical protein
LTGQAPADGRVAQVVDDSAEEVAGGCIGHGCYRIPMYAQADGERC